MDIFDYEVVPYWRYMDRDYEWCNVCHKITFVGHIHENVLEDGIKRNNG